MTRAGQGVAYPGVEGAFSHEACRRFLPDKQAVPVASFADVVDAVRRGDAAFGMLPVENNEAGETGARQLIESGRLHVLREEWLPVRMHLLALPSADLEQIETVVSHPVALRQCSKALSRLGVATEQTSNTAVAAKNLADPHRAVLASEAAAEIYGLQILKRDFHDRSDNATRFAIVCRRSDRAEKSDVE